MIAAIALWWCRHFHGAPYWPIFGEYRCRVCRRVYPAWTGGLR